MNFPRFDFSISPHIVFTTMALAYATSLSAATLPNGFSETRIATGLNAPTAMEFAPDGRLFVCQQPGQLRVIKNFTLLTTPFLTVATDDTGERGLLGIAFDPGFATNQFLYLYYTATSPVLHNRVSRFTASGDVVAPGSEVPILDLEALGASNHNGGAIHFGPDGTLFVAVGENANSSNSQTLNNRLGKVLRIRRDGSIPTDNPFYTIATGNNRAIWAMGLRNPFTFAFQPGTGRLFINDVGQSTWEEINIGIAGANFGWPNCEGRCGNPSYQDPLYQYGHGANPNTNGCAITGGAFYNAVAAQYPSAYRGTYFFADSCAGWIRRVNPDTAIAADFALNVPGPVDLKVSAEGRLFYLERGVGSVWVIDYTNAPPALGIQASANGATILWPSPSTGFTLQSSVSVTSGWGDASTGVQTTNGQKRLNVAGGGAQFFRLVKP